MGLSLIVWFTHVAFTPALVTWNVLKTGSWCFTVSLPSSIHEKGPAGAVQGVYSSMPMGIIKQSDNKHSLPTTSTRTCSSNANIKYISQTTNNGTP